jgi:hypothetical protein
MLVQKKKDFLFTYKNEAEERERKRSEERCERNENRIVA